MRAPRQLRMLMHLRSVQVRRCSAGLVEGAFQQHTFVSVPAPLGADISLRCFQILHKRRKHVLQEAKTKHVGIQRTECCLHMLDILGEEMKWAQHRRH